MKTAVVTGCSGFIGHHFTMRLLKDNWIVYGIDIKEPEYEMKFNSFFQFQKVDICDLKELPDCDYVFHFAAETHVHNSIQDCKEFIRTNIEGTRNLLELIRNKSDNIRTKPIMFHVSTDEVYGDTLDTQPSVETDALRPTNNYSVTKTAADLLVQSYGRTYGIEYVIIRPSNNFGTHQLSEKLIPLTIKLLLSEKKVRLHNGGTPIRTWIHVDDTIEAIKTIINKNERGIFNIGGYQCSNMETVSLIMKAMSIENPQERLDLNFVRPGQDMSYNVNDTKLRQLGWSPQKKLANEIDSIVNWYLQEPIYRLF